MSLRDGGLNSDLTSLYKMRHFSSGFIRDGGGSQGFQKPVTRSGTSSTVA
jgi:hypothetical protein